MVDRAELALQLFLVLLALNAELAVRVNEYGAVFDGFVETAHFVSALELMRRSKLLIVKRGVDHLATRTKPMVSDTDVRGRELR